MQIRLRRPRPIDWHHEAIGWHPPTLIDSSFADADSILHYWRLIDSSSLDADWLVLTDGDRLFELTRQIHLRH